MSRNETIAGDNNVEDETIERVMKGESDIWDIIEACLPEKEFEVVCMRYHGKLSLEAVTKHLGVSRERVRKLEVTGIRHLRHPHTVRAISERYEREEFMNRHISYNAPISQMGITRSENTERRRQSILEARENSVISITRLEDVII